MKIDVAQIDRRIKKLEELRRVVSDPETASLLETMLMNGTAAAPANIDAGDPPKALFKEGSQVAAIAQAAMQCDKPFSGYQLAAKMQESGYKFHTARPGLTATDVLRNVLLKRGVVKIYKKGRGSDPMLFERIL